MQFLVFAAFALVLSVPQGGPPWSTIKSRALIWAIIAGQILIVGLVGSFFSWLVQRRLEREPAWLSRAQRRLAQGNLLVRVVLIVGLVVSLYLTDWEHMIRTWVPLRVTWGLPEMIMLLPFLTGILVGWIGLYGGDQAIREVALELKLWSMSPVRPVWTLRQYLSFNFRQHVLIILAPMIPILIANDLTFAYRHAIRRAVGVVWADQAVVVIVAGLVFLLAPVMLRHIWHTRVLPPGELRERLEGLCRRIGLTYRRILVWDSDGMVINAAVMGLVRPVRYILLSDGLIELMDDGKIEAVFGHEAGHVKLRHIEFYLLFAITSLFVVGGIFELVQAAGRHWPGLLPHGQLLQDYLQIAAMVLIVLVWGLGFGLVSRRFEWHADLFGARSVTPSAEQCDRPCIVHGTAQAPAPVEPGSAVCATAAQVFADALHRIAALNGIPVEARSWRHSSIANRMQRLRLYARDPRVSRRLERAVLLIKSVLLVGTIIGLTVGTWLYWPQSGTGIFRFLWTPRPPERQRIDHTPKPPISAQSAASEKGALPHPNLGT